MFQKRPFVHCVLALFLMFVGITILDACTTTQQPTTINYVEYPSFFYSNNSYHTVLVAPVENALEPEKYIPFVSTNLMAKVQQNGAYKVIDATKETKDESALAARAREVDPNALVLTSIITNYGEVRSSDLGSIGIYDSSSYKSTAASSDTFAASGRKVYANSSAYASESESRKSVSLPVLSFNRGMYAKLNVILKRASDGEIVANEFVYSLVTESGFFGLNMSENEERLKRALDGMTTNAVYYLAPSNETLKVEPDKILLVQKYGKEDWESTSKYNMDETIRIVFAMPMRVAFNDFELVLKADGRPDPVDYQAINYNGPVVLEYKPADLVQSTGVTNYTVQAIYGGKVISKKNFKINQPK